MRETSLTSQTFVLSCLLFLAAAPGERAEPTVLQPQIGIDTSFGDRVNEATTAFRFKHYQEAIAKINVALAMKPDDKNASILYAMRGNAFWNLDNEDRALADYNEAIRRDRTVKGVYGRRGILNYNKGNYAAATADLTVGLRSTRDPGYVYYSRALAFLKQGKHDLARLDFERVTQAPALQAQGYVDRGKAFLQLDNPAKAVLDFATARRMSSADGMDLNSIAWFEATSSHSEFRNGKAAVRDATRACQLSKWKNADIIDTLAAAYAEQGDFGHAMSYQRQAIALQADLLKQKELREHLALFEHGAPVREDITIK